MTEPNESRGRRGRRYLILSAVLAVVWAEAARAGDCRQVETLPARITAPGNYCLGATLRLETPAEAAIAVEADSVVLDLRGHALEAGPGRQRRAAGIQVTNQRRVTVRNGVVRGFDRGLTFEGAEGGFHRVEGVVVEGSRAVGLRLEGRGNLARGNRIVDTVAGEDAAALGIQVHGPLARILDNQVQNTTGGAGATGIRLDGADASVLERNRIANDRTVPHSTGIEVVASRDVLLVGNEISNVERRFRQLASSWVRRDERWAERPREEDLQGNDPAPSAPEQ